jgi:hypothetical protein
MDVDRGVQHDRHGASEYGQQRLHQKKRAFHVGIKRAVELGLVPLFDGL